jgi:transposase InsO family protein
MQRLIPTVPSEGELILRAWLRGLASSRPRYGYRRMHALLNMNVCRVNTKRLQRLCRYEGLRVGAKTRKRARIGQSTFPSDSFCAQRPNHVWAMNFQLNQTSDCRVLKYLNIT